MIYIKDVMRDSYSSITRLPEKSDEYGLMHVMAVKGSKNSYSLSFDLSNTRHLIECIFGMNSAFWNISVVNSTV